MVSAAASEAGLRFPLRFWPWENTTGIAAIVRRMADRMDMYRGYVNRSLA